MAAQELLGSAEPVLAWASRAFGRPWQRMAAVARRISAGEALSPAEATVAIPGTPFAADWRVIFPLLKDAMPLLAFEPADFCLLVLDAGRAKILRAFHSRARDNNFIELTEIEVKEEWSQEAVAILGSDSVSRLRTFLDRYLQESSKRRVSWVIAADLRLLERLRAAAAAGGAVREPSLRDWLYHHYLALQAALAEGSIAVIPVPNLLARIFEYCRMIHYRREHYGVASPGGEVCEPPLGAVLWIRGAHYTAGFNLAAKAGEPLTLTQETGEALPAVPFSGLARAGAKAAKAGLSLALNADLGLNLLYEILSRPTPLETHDSKIILEKAFQLVRRFQDQWDVYPRPLPLQTAARLPALLFGLPYDIRNLASWFFPGLIVDGARYLLGETYQVGLYALEQGRLAGITILKLRRGALEGVESLPAAEYAEVFGSEPPTAKEVQAAVIRLRQRIWDRWGWVDYQVAYRRELFGELSRLLKSGAPFALRKLWWQSSSLRRIGKILEQGGLVIYPAAMLEEGGRWGARQPLSQRLVMLKVAFERGKQTRGLLYVRETIIGLVILIGLALLLGWRFY